jgi:tight adherence protein B
MNVLTTLLGHRWSMTDTLRFSSVAVLGFAFFLATLQMATDETGIAWRYWTRYTVALERRLRSMFMFTPGHLIVTGQVAMIVVILAAKLTVDLPAPWLFIAGALIAPFIYIERMRRERVQQIEEELDAFLLALANALKGTASIGAALESIISIITGPIKDELELCLKEMRVGSSLDQALLSMASRAGSRQLDSALSAILIGRQVGGNLPKLLETTAASLREMKRLESIIRTKTAEGRMQMWVIGAMPAVFLVGFSVAWPGYFEPLTQSISGYILIAFVSGCWVLSLILARKVLAVDF